MTAGCGENDEQAARPTTDEGYAAVSDVSAHAAVGKDIAAIRSALDSADFETAAQIWSEGRNSKKDDGTMRTLAGFVEDHPVGAQVSDALAGAGDAAQLPDEQRAQWVDKGMIAALEVKVLGELDAALEKARAGETDAAEGAPHNVDEAWAFFTAGGEGLSATAAKRAADFGLAGEVVEPVLAALRTAQAAAKDGDPGDLLAARDEAEGALNLIFALAVTKYANEGIEDPTARAEGLAFSWGLQGDLPTAALETIRAAFGEKAGFKAALKVRETLNASLSELRLAQPVPPYES
jgi:hypothetical protein